MTPITPIRTVVSVGTKPFIEPWNPCWVPAMMTSSAKKRRSAILRKAPRLGTHFM